ncbi:sensor histidine kinase [Rubrolithibacter danxiaensis]|uniref:sensor histidine kinase n=1 Tax=Rubrolithibacter danxiaensis TaxID=3390805 RepID=UPI003BF7CC0A
MKIKTKIFLAFIFILALFAFTTLINYRLTQAVNYNTEWLRNSQEVIRNSSRLQRNILNMESAVNGYVLTQENSFLNIYRGYIKENDLYLQEIRNYIGKPQKVRLNKIDTLYRKWIEIYAKPYIRAANDSSTSQRLPEDFKKLRDQNKKGKEFQNELEDEFKAFNDYEYSIREVRRAELASSIASTRTITLLLMILSLVIGISAVYYITSIISKRISGMVTLADRLAKGNFNSLIEDNSKDEMSSLSLSLNTMASILNDTITKLQRRNDELDSFAYVVSHDLKAPLLGIENLSRWIEEDMPDNLPDDIKEFLLLMRLRIQRMENLIDGILELARVGRTKSRAEEVDVNTLLNHVTTILNPPRNMKIEIQPGMPVVTAEKIYLEQIFTNLISNAIKYHDKELGLISITFKETEKTFEFSVKDNGPGIEPEYHDKIFLIFQTLKERDSFESTGIGLTIVKKILDDKNCFIKLASKPGKGSTFTFSWPKNVSYGEYSTS